MNATARQILAIVAAAGSVGAGYYLISWGGDLAEDANWFEAISTGLGIWMMACGVYFAGRLWPTQDEIDRDRERDQARREQIQKLKPPS